MSRTFLIFALLATILVLEAYVSFFEFYLKYFEWEIFSESPNRYCHTIKIEKERSSMYETNSSKEWTI